MAKLIAAVEVAGVHSEVGGLIAGAVVYATHSNEPIFSIEGKKRRFFTRDREKLTPHLLKQVGGFVRENADGYATASISVAVIKQIGLQAAKVQVMGHAVARAVERITHLRGDSLRHLNLRELAIWVPGDEVLPPEYVHSTPILHNVSDWRLGAAYVLSNEAYYYEMLTLNRKYPQYNLLENQGVLTDDHKRAIKRFGLSPEHRS